MPGYVWNGQEKPRTTPPAPSEPAPVLEAPTAPAKPRRTYGRVRPGPRPDPVIAQVVREQSELGKSCREIAESLGCAPETISRWRKRLGIARINPRTAERMTEEKRSRVLRLFEDGLSRQEVHRTTGISVHTLARHFPDLKWERVECSRLGAAVKHHRIPA